MESIYLQKYHNKQKIWQTIIQYSQFFTKPARWERRTNCGYDFVQYKKYKTIAKGKSSKKSHNKLAQNSY